MAESSKTREVASVSRTKQAAKSPWTGVVVSLLSLMAVYVEDRIGDIRAEAEQDELAEQAAALNESVVESYGEMSSTMELVFSQILSRIDRLETEQDKLRNFLLTGEFSARDRREENQDRRADDVPLEEALEALEALDAAAPDMVIER